MAHGFLQQLHNLNQSVLSVIYLCVQLVEGEAGQQNSPEIPVIALSSFPTVAPSSIKLLLSTQVL